MRSFHIGDSDIGKQRRESFGFATGEVPKRSGPSICGGHVEEIGESTGILDTRDSREQRISVVGVVKFRNTKPQKL
jgi:hypothetical protein